jgi:hypothetical protein
MLGRNGVPEASASRCWFIKMKPRLPTEVVEDFLFEDDAEFAGIRAAAARWTADHRDELKKLQQTVAMPEGFADRLRDVFKLVFAVADKIGGGWLARMHAAALEIAHAGDVNISWHRRALQDLRTYFVDERGNVRPWVKSDQFMSWLLSDEDSPWHSYKGRKVTKWQIAALIRVNFEIETKLVGPKRGRARGWTPDQFADDFARVLKDPLPSRSPVHHPSRKPPKR